nr:MAG TPA: hypothetical protein [Bacteriophage sp.]DAV77910.1 MAG TPA: hypothetical protein [Bacteriophage sp.]
MTRNVTTTEKSKNGEHFIAQSTNRLEFLILMQ